MMFSFLEIEDNDVVFSNTDLSGAGAFPTTDNGSLHTVIAQRQEAQVLEAQPLINEYLPSRIEKKTLDPPPDPVVAQESSSLNRYNFFKSFK